MRVWVLLRSLYDDDLTTVEAVFDNQLAALAEQDRCESEDRRPGWGYHVEEHEVRSE